MKPFKQEAHRFIPKDGLVKAELRYLRDLVVMLLGSALVLFVEFRLMSQLHLSIAMIMTIIVTTVVVGFIGYIVVLTRQGSTHRSAPPARVAPAIVALIVCSSGFYEAIQIMRAPEGGSPGRAALELTTALLLGLSAIPGAGTAFKSAINRFCAADRQPAPSTHASVLRGYLRLTVVLAAVVAFMVLLPRLGFPYTLLAVWFGMSVAMILTERYANLRSSPHAY